MTRVFKVKRKDSLTLPENRNRRIIKRRLHVKNSVEDSLRKDLEQWKNFGINRQREIDLLRKKNASFYATYSQLVKEVEDSKKEVKRLEKHVKKYQIWFRKVRKRKKVGRKSRKRHENKQELFIRMYGGGKTT